MPRRTRVPKVRRRHHGELTKRQREELFLGWSLIGHGFDGEDERRTAWQEHREVLLRAWIAEHPRTRPWGWWAFDAPEMRRPVEGAIPATLPASERTGPSERVPTPRSAADREWLATTYRGVPKVQGGDIPGGYEPEAAYLERLGLLQPGECEVMAARG